MIEAAAVLNFKWMIEVAAALNFKWMIDLTHQANSKWMIEVWDQLLLILVKAEDCLYINNNFKIIIQLLQVSSWWMIGQEDLIDLI